MQPEENLNNQPGGTGEGDAIVCPHCGAPMPREMRFCRACGSRLGEGPAEYTETVRFPHVAPTTPQVAGPFAPPYTAPIAAQAGSGFP